MYVHEDRMLKALESIERNLENIAERLRCRDQYFHHVRTRYLVRDFFKRLFRW